jgi:DNA-binding response OmpR family regulator
MHEDSIQDVLWGRFSQDGTRRLRSTLKRLQAKLEDYPASPRTLTGVPETGYQLHVGTPCRLLGRC